MCGLIDNKRIQKKNFFNKKKKTGGNDLILQQAAGYRLDQSTNMVSLCITLVMLMYRYF